MPTKQEGKHTPGPEIIADIRHCMEMYPEKEVDLIVRAVNCHEEMLAFIKEFKKSVEVSYLRTETKTRLWTKAGFLIKKAEAPHA